MEFIKTNFVNAAIWLVSASCIKKVGGFNPSFFHYGEDNEYCNRVRSRGLQIAILPSAIGIHDRENRPVYVSKSKEKLNCLNYAKIDFFKSTKKNSFSRSSCKILFNSWGFQLNNFERIIVLLRFLREFKNISKCKEIISSSEKPFLNSNLNK